jgi:hypothetical protein
LDNQETAQDSTNASIIRSASPQPNVNIRDAEMLHQIHNRGACAVQLTGYTAVFPLSVTILMLNGFSGKLMPD